MPLCRRRLLATVVACACLPGSATAEVIPGRNVNMVSGTDWPGGDPFLQRQNEGSMASSTRNPLHLLAGGNDYRTVDIPGLPEGRLVGDAWHGLFWSRDGGHRWRSTLLPGYPQDSSPEGLASPLKGLEAGADAVLRSGTNGLVYYAGIAFNRAAIPENARGTGKEGKLFVARFIDDNAKETGNPFRALGISVAGLGDEELFLDKPWLAVDVPRSDAGTCVIPGSGEIPAQQFKAGNVYLSYTAVSGDPSNLKTRLFLTRSRDCGQTWSAPVRLTNGKTVDQGTVIAIHPLTGWVYVAWRRIDPVERTAAFLLAISIDGGRSFSKPITIAHLAPYTLEDGVTKVASVFEQGTSIVSFRTTGFPALTVDRLGIVYAAWAERGVGPGGDARIVVKRSPGGLFWWWPAEPANRSEARGHELMPSLLYHGGRILLVHYTLAEDHTVGILTPSGGGAFTETRQPAGDLAAPADPTKVFREFVADTAPGGLKRRHTMDVWVREAEPTLCDFDLDFTSSRRVSQYYFGDVGGADAGTIKQLGFNPPNLPMYQCQGDLANCVAFIGDYVDVAGAAPFVPKGHGWTYNLDRRRAGTAHVVWADNRDVRPPPPGKTWADYTPPQSPFSATLPSQSLFDPSQERPQCLPGEDGFTTAGMRNQNLYTSRLTEGLVAVSPQNAKPLGFGVLPGGETVLLQRSFVVVVQNTSEHLRTFRLTIRNQPADGPPTGKASFLPFPDPALPDPLTELFLNVGARSSATRTVFVTSTQPDASIVVDVQEASAPGGEVIPPEAGGLLATVVLNPDITNPDLTNPDITNPDITNPDITNAEVYNPDITNPDITNPDITNPDITNPDITNPDITNPDITNPDITNAQVVNPDITNPDITNPDITNPDITNPDITNPDITNVGPGSYTDATWTVTDNGNTSAGYKVKLLMDGPLPPGFKAQLILHKGYSTPVAVGCDLALQRQSIVIANIPDPVFVDPLSPDITNPDLTNPDVTNATLFVAPGDDWAQVTLRLFDPVPGDDVTAEDVLSRVTPAIVAHAVNTIEAAAGSRTPPVAVPATTVVFTQPPSLGSAGVPLSPPVSVQVRDNAGAVVPGAEVTLALAVNPTEASLEGNTATTDAVGVAAFPALTVDRAGAGYRLQASAGDLAPALSAPFSILEACAADGAPSVSSYAVEGPDVSSFPLASREAADFDGDGNRDLAVIHGDGTITKMAGNGLGAFERAFQLRIGTTKTPRGLAVGDFNEDGLTDVVVAYTDSSQLGVVLSDRSPQAPFFTATPVVLALAGGPSAVAAGDVDGDGHLDVIATLETADAIAVLLGDGQGGFAAPTTFPAGHAPLALALGRFDADAALDVAVVHYPDDGVFVNGSVSVLIGDGLGGFAVANTTVVGVNPASIATGDLDADGRLDVAVANQGGHDVTVLFGDGGGGFRESRAVPAGATPSSVAIGDFDADERLDLATANGPANTFSLVFGDGAGGFGPPGGFAAGTEPVDVSAGDFNADGRADLVITNRLHQGACCDQVSIAISTCGATTADLSVQLSDAPDPVGEGAALTYTAVVTNKGPFAATGVVLTQSVPGPVQVASPSAGVCGLGSSVVCDLGRLDPGQAATVTVVVTAPSGVGSVVSRATAAAAELDRFPGDNTVAATTSIQSGPRLLAVTNTNDSGPGSLRQALQDSNASARVRDTIVFAIPGDAPHTIAAASALPEITDPVVIDATPDGCTGAPPRVEIDGTAAGAAHGLVVLAGDTTIRGLAVTGFEGHGIAIRGGSGGVVECSHLGVAPDGVTAKGNGLAGVSLELQATGNVIGANHIAFNGGSGIDVAAGAGAGNLLVGNRLHANGGLGIDLGGDGPTANDPGDGDTGPNNLQNSPVLTGASTDGNDTRVLGLLQSTPNTPMRVDFFLNAACDPSGRGEGDTGLASLTASTNENGDLFIDVRLGPLPVGSVITALATTDPRAPSPNDTSEHSDCVAVVGGVAPDGFSKIWVGGTPTNEKGWTGPSNWSPEGMPSAEDDVYVQPAVHMPVVNVPNAVTRSLTVAQGASLALGGFTLTSSGHVDVTGAMSGPGTLRMAPPSLGTLRGTVPALTVEGLVMPGPGSFVVEGDVAVVSAGLLDPANQVVSVGGDLSTTGTGILRMTPGALLDVGGDARFDGGATEGELISGTLRVHGSFSQGNQASGAAFAASGNHLTILAGAGTTVSFASPGRVAGTSHFNTLRLDMPGDVTLLSDVHGVGPLVTTGPTPPIVLGGGKRLAFQGLNVFRLVLDNAPLSSNAGVLSRFDDVTFQRFGAAPPLVVVHAGPPQPFVLSGLDFGPTAGVEVLLFASDEAPTDDFALQLELVGASPAAGCGFVTASGGASVTWNGIRCGQ